MESFGEILKESREQKNLSVDQIARDTRISRRYLEALEAEDFTAFPGETYLMGFLRNYADYLDLNGEDLVILYRNMKIQEQPLPMDELLNVQKGLGPAGMILVVVLAVAVLGGGGYALFRFLGARQSTPEVAEESEPEAGGQRILFETDGLTQWFTKGDIITVPLGERRHNIEVSTIDEEKVELIVPGATVRLSFSEDRFLDLDLDSRPDIKMVYNDIDLLAAERRVNLGLTKILESEQLGTASASAQTEQTLGETAGTPETGDTVATEAEGADVLEQPIVPATIGPRATVGDRTVVVTADTPETFGVRIDFRGSTLFRYAQDGTSGEQRFFQRAETFSVDNVRRGIQLWISNAGAVRVLVQGEEIAMGRPGQVVTKRVEWVQNETSGRYQLQVVSVF